MVGILRLQAEEEFVKRLGMMETGESEDQMMSQMRVDMSSRAIDQSVETSEDMTGRIIHGNGDLLWEFGIEE